LGKALASRKQFFFETYQMKRTLLRSLIAIIVLLVAYLLLWPVPINPAAWTPPTAPDLTGVYAQNSELSKIERLHIDGNKPEDVNLGNYDPSAAPAQQCRNPVHCAELSNDRLLYVCDRVNDRIQVFKPEGTFVWL
jgi:hypothetical protein